MEKNIKKVENLIKKCDECKLKECINCEISWTDVTAINKLLKGYKNLKEENKELIWERDYYKLRFEELNKQWNRVIHKLLGENYYNYGCDWKTCDEFTADDLIYKYKKRWWQFWKKI